MKKDIHPQYYQAKVSCACGNSFIVGSTKQAIQTDICSACHPFFTGEQRFIDTQGRVEKFVKKQQVAAKHLATKKAKNQVAEKKEYRPRTLREMLQKKQ